MRGHAGQLFQDLSGVPRRALSITHVVACQPPTDLRTYLLQAKRDGLNSPVDCCAPRLNAVVAGYDNIIPAGDIAAKLVLGSTKGLLSLRGGPLSREREGHRVRVLPMLSPGLIAKQRHFVPVAKGDWARAWRHFDDALLWGDYQYDVVDSLTAIARLTAAIKAGYPISYDVETDSKYPRTANLRCIGFSYTGGSDDVAFVVPMRSVTGAPVGDQGIPLLEWLGKLWTGLLGESGIWVGHNAGSFDRMVMERHCGASPPNLVDTILLHRAAAPLLRHDLGTVGTTLTDVTSWKADEDGHKIANIDAKDIEKALSGALGIEAKGAAQHTAAERDRILYEYCGRDCMVVSRVVEPLAAQAAAVGYFDPVPMPGPWETLAEADRFIQNFCVNLHQTGIPIHEEYRANADTWLTALAQELRKEVIERAIDLGAPAYYNPNSPDQVRSLLFDKLGLEPVEHTKTGLVATGDNSVRTIMLTPGVDKRIIALLKASRKFKRVANKWLATYIAPFHPLGKRLKHGLGRKEPLVFDGRVHSSWSAHGTIVGRLSASGPNMQTIPAILKYVFAARPGNLLAGADADQIHLRIIAWLWNVEKLQECFARGGDPHAENALAIFGELFLKAKGHPAAPDFKWKGQAKQFRQIAKIFVYAAAYGASADTILSVLRKAEDDEGNLVMAHLKIGDVHRMHDQWLKSMPEFERGWAHEIETARTNGIGGLPWLADPILGRRRTFDKGVNDPEEQNAIRNYRVLATESAIMHTAEHRLLSVLPFGKWGPGTGIIAQVHDSISAECPAEHAKDVAELIAESLRCEYGGIPFTATPTFGHTYADA